MADTTFINGTVIEPAWLNDINDAVYTTVPAINTNLADTSNVANGDALIGVKRTFTGAVATTQHAWHEAQVIDLVADLSADPSGVADCTTLFQSAITAGNLRVGPGTFNLTGDITIPSNRKIIIEKGATVINTGGRFTAYDVENVHWHIDGKVQSVTMTAAAAKSGWPNVAGGWFGDERGFIEFGGASDTTPKSGFVLTGAGTVSGDWTGTAAAATSADVNFKGICALNARDVRISVAEVFGFKGEAVYFFGIYTTTWANVVFEGIYSHDNKFNNLNFNAIGPTLGLSIRNCITKNGYAGIEMSVGEAHDNIINTPLVEGIWTGAGGGTGPITMKNNIVNGVSSGPSYYLVFSAQKGPIVFHDNVSIDAYDNSFLFDTIKDFSIKGNVSYGNGTGASGYALNIGNSTNGFVEGNRAMLPGANDQGAQYGHQAAASNTSVYFDSGDFTPTATGITVVGTPTYTGRFNRSGNRVFCTIHAVSTTSIATTYGASYFTGLPYNVLLDDAVVTAYSSASLATTLVQASTKRAYLPTIGATGEIVSMSFSYITDE